MNDAKLRQLESASGNTPQRMYDDSDNDGSAEYIEKWVAEDSPRVWKIAQTKNGFQAWQDVGHGDMALFKGLVLVGYNKGQTWNNSPPIITTPECVYLGEGYWGCNPGQVLFFS